MKTKYVSFCGTFLVPENAQKLEHEYPMTYDIISEGIDSHGNERLREIEKGFRSGLEYTEIDSHDSLSVYLAVIDPQTGHLVADCPAGGWAHETFVVLKDGEPVRAEDNFNPNPIRQLG